MAKRWQILIHGYGFLAELDPGYTAIGFYTARRVVADSQREAEVMALESVWKEDKIQALLNKTKEKTGTTQSCQIVANETIIITWFQWVFKGYARGLVFYDQR